MKFEGIFNYVQQKCLKLTESDNYISFVFIEFFQMVLDTCSYWSNLTRGLKM